VNPEPQLSGTVDLALAGAWGLVDWQSTQTDLSGYADFSSGISLDVRPRSDVRFFSRISTALSASDLSIPMFGLSELFFDYTFEEAVFFRVGKQTLAWGQGLLLGNPGNLVSDIAGSFSMRAFTPLGTNGLTVIAYGNPAWYSGPESYPVSPYYLAYAGQLETSVGGVNLGFSGKFRYLEEQSVAAYFKTVVGSTDVVMEGRVTSSDVLTGVPADYDYYALLGAFHEFPNWRFLSEYQFEAVWNSTLAGRGILHRGGVGFLSSSFWVAGWKPGFRWFHALETMDGQYLRHSGQITIGATRPVNSVLSLDLGIPITYGSPDSFYRVNNEDPGGRVAAVVLQLNLNVNF
jgi:hypothetical protein